MDKGELVFHLIVPSLMIILTFSMGYYVFALVRSIMKVM